MEQFGLSATIVTIIGIGGWAGVWHAAVMCMAEEQFKPARAVQLLILPLMWGGAALVAYVGGIAAMKTSSVIYGAMFHPVPFVLNMLTMCVVVCAITVVAGIRKSFRATMQTVVEELAADAREAAEREAAQQPPDSDEDASEAEEADDEEAEETDDDEEAEEADDEETEETDDDNAPVPEELSQAPEAAPDQAADIVPEEAALPNSPVTPEMTTVAASAVPVTPLRSLSPVEPVEPIAEPAAV